jgi:hypothetical protein
MILIEANTGGARMGSGQSQKPLDPQRRQLHQKVTENACVKAKEEKYKQMGATDAQVARIDVMIEKYLRNKVIVEKEGLDRRAIIAVILTQGRKRGYEVDSNIYKACLQVFNVLYEIPS